MRIAAWAGGFELIEDDQGVRYHGTEGMPGDVMARMERLDAAGRPGFSQAALVIGRRGSKGFVSAILVA